MFCRILGASLAVILGLSFSAGEVFAESDPSRKSRVLSSENSGLNIRTINIFLNKAESSIKSGNLDEAINHLIKARTVSKLLLSYFRDINGSFRGIDALIPREMSKKNRLVINLLSKANLRLATIHRSKNEPELAVPLLVEVIKILTPVKPKGAKAYQQLVELGFVDTSFRGAK